MTCIHSALARDKSPGVMRYDPTTQMTLPYWRVMCRECGDIFCLRAPLPGKEDAVWAQEEIDENGKPTTYRRVNTEDGTCE